MTTYELVKEVIQQRRSVRHYMDRPVELEHIREIMECARYAPSDTNSQTWEFIAILNRDIIKQIEELTWDALHKRGHEAEALGLAREARMLTRSFGPYATAFSDAPVLIIALATPYTSKFRERIFDPIGLVPDSIWEEEGIKSSCLAIQNVMLAAHARGLATCPMTGPVLLAEAAIKQLLDIPHDRQVNMVLALGYPKVTPASPARKEVDDILRIIQ
ncbi:nitroreductase family protein [Paenibacillus sp. 481]|uniref:nitroreductase family protein n=1 Tax=Paenibacillus sp. 481 TaxID=2835869 RepID=UPI001E3D368C|nr:nitroreductase family protein [Paenibacillus sp. 481]UHA72593.1 nitroreductase family protein [Paenibacillus sp. 481]